MKFTPAVIEKWSAMVDSWIAQEPDLFNRLRLNQTLNQAVGKVCVSEGAQPTPELRNRITTGRAAWSIANRCGILREAYQDNSVTDGHIQTALKRVFPNAIFKDKPVY